MAKLAAVARKQPIYRVRFHNEGKIFELCEERRARRPLRVRRDRRTGLGTQERYHRRSDRAGSQERVRWRPTHPRAHACHRPHRRGREERRRKDHLVESRRQDERARRSHLHPDQFHPFGVKRARNAQTATLTAPGPAGDQRRIQRGNRTSPSSEKTTSTASPIRIVVGSIPPGGASAEVTRFPTKRMFGSSSSETRTTL